VGEVVEAGEPGVTDATADEPAPAADQADETDEGAVDEAAEPDDGAAAADDDAAEPDDEEEDK